MKAVRIPKERVGALIGKDGASKRMLQERMQMTIRVDTEGEVFIEDENAKDPVMSLKAVDIITDVDGKPAADIHLYDLRRNLRNEKPGTVVAFTVKDGSTVNSVKVTLRDQI